MHFCRGSSLITLPIKFLRISDLFKKKENFSSSNIDRVRAILSKEIYESLVMQILQVASFFYDETVSLHVIFTIGKVQ